ncbi:MAG: formate dehydrogenase subunit delta [Pseudohongiellaceae bacterium]|jgi:formate dehydrogenase subunit delta
MNVSANELGHLIKMANQIAANIGLGVSEDETVERVVKHINSFWARPMREKICVNMHTSADQLDGITMKALAKIDAQL